MLKSFKQLNFDLIWLWLCLFIIFSSLFYFIYQINIYSLVFSLIFSYLPVKWIDNQKILSKINNEKKLSILSWFYLISYFTFLLISFYILFSSRTDQAIISPWSVIPLSFYLFFSLTAFSLLLYFNQSKQKTIINNLIIFLFYFLNFSVAIIIYKLGYGFDPHIHEASLNHILENGYILPKNPYYIGQYSLILASHQFLGLPLSLLNKMLLPFLAALIIPNLIKKFLNNNLVICLALFLGFSPFIITTPQNLAYLFLFATIIFSLNKQVFPYGLFSALATFFIHPLAGIIAIIFSLYTINQEYLLSNKLRKILRYIILISPIFIIPISLIIGSKAQFILSKNNYSFFFFWLNKENIFLNIIYFFYYNSIYLLFILIIAFLIKFRNRANFFKIKSSLLFSLIIFLTYLISLNLNWSNLIIYEQSDYANRLLIIAYLFLIPYLLLILKTIITQIQKTNKIIKIIIIASLSLGLTINLYLNYPRQDNYYNSRGFSVSNSDLIAIEKIANLARNDYIVLANQQVSVLAIKKMGFDNYISSPLGPLYFYSIPTGGPLYNFYLDMVYQEANRNTMYQAMKLAQVSEAFLVINNYWWASDKIIAEAKLSADYYYSINQGELMIFHYILKE